jgi:hypothetical protein
MSDFWENKHRLEDAYWLTGSGVDSYSFYHNINWGPLKGKKILEIGVGTGNFLNQCNDFLLYASDISTTALNRINHLVISSYLSKDINKCPEVDLAICHLVFQHNNISEVERIINEVNLTTTGIFSFQYAECTDFTLAKEKDPNMVLNETHFFHSYEDIENVVNNSNKKILQHHSKVKVARGLHWNICKVYNFKR